MRAQELAEERCRGCLSVRSRNGADGSAGNLPREFHLGCYADAARARRPDERNAIRNGGREDEQIDAGELFFPLCAKDAGDSLRPQRCDMCTRFRVLFKLRLGFRIRERHVRPFARKIFCRGIAADARADDERSFSPIGQSLCPP